MAGVKNLTTLLNTVEKADVIKTWPGHYRVYAKEAIVFVFFDKKGILTHYSDTITPDGFNRINIPENACATLSGTISKKIASLYNIQVQEAITLRNSRNK